jgi:tRNA A-37 threonylcarbamoyl transferase component Bud32
MTREQARPGPVDPEPTLAIADMDALLAEPADLVVVRAPAPPARVAERYELGPVVGRGGMADVHRARDVLLDREVAVKLLRDEATSETARARFTAEARTLAQLSDPGLVMVLDAGTSEDRPYLVMELVEGTTLAAVLADGPLSAQEAARILRGVAEALSYAHGQGVVHRDVKPGNVLVSHDGRVKLADFGIARLVGDAVRHTTTGTAIGTVSYLAPEQVSGDGLSHAVDVYALGLVLLEALTGERAFTGPTAEAALARLTRDPEIPADLPPAWLDLLRAMTAREPADRPSAEQVAARLAALELGDTHGLTPLAPAAPVAGGRRRARVLAAAAALAAAAVLAAGTGLLGPGEPTVADKAVPDRTPSAAAATKDPRTPEPVAVASTPPATERAESADKPKRVHKPKQAEPKKAKAKAKARAKRHHQHKPPKHKGEGKGKGRR